MGLRTTAQQATLTGLRWTGLDRMLRSRTAGAGAILTLHRVRPPSGAAFAPNAHLEVTPQFLGAAVDRIRAAGVDIVDLDEALRRLAGGGKRFVAITLDDGYRDNLEHALPVLKARGAPFTVFVASGFPDRTINPWWMTLEAAIAANDAVRVGDRTFSTATATGKQAAFDVLVNEFEAMDEDRQGHETDRLAETHGIDPRAMVDAAFMTWDEVKRLAAERLVTIGGHTEGHHALARLSPDRARADVMRGAEAIAQRLGWMPRHFAYPYGHPSAAGEREFAMLAELGFASAVRTVPGVLTAAHALRPTALPRISLNGHFQKLRYVDVLLSGVPFAAQDLIGRLRGRRAMPAGAAAASSG